MSGGSRTSGSRRKIPSNSELCGVATNEQGEVNPSRCTRIRSMNVSGASWRLDPGFGFVPGLERETARFGFTSWVSPQTSPKVGQAPSGRLRLDWASGAARSTSHKPKR